MILLMASNYQNPINLGNSKEFSINELALLVRNLINPKLNLKYQSLPLDDPKRRNPSIELAKEKLSWEPKVGLKEGLTKTINWYRKNLK